MKKYDDRENYFVIVFFTTKMTKTFFGFCYNCYKFFQHFNTLH